MIGTLAVALLAGALSTLSPCVLPLVPIVLGTAVSQHKYGPAALAAGLALSFTLVGLFIATIGFSLGLGGETVRMVGAGIMLALGVVLLVPPLQARVALAGGGIGQWAEERFGGTGGEGLGGQFAVGLLLGAVWSPCVGPTLGAASVLAAQGENLGTVALTMAMFGIGAALPLLALGTLSREAMMRWRGRLMSAGGWGKSVLGAGLVAVGLFILAGLDRLAETFLVRHSPEWLTELTTRF